MFDKLWNASLSDWALALSIPVMLLAPSLQAYANPPRWETLPLEQPLPPLTEGRVAHQGGSLWYGVGGAGKPVILLHGGRATSASWGNQVQALIASQRQVILIDSRGHGRSSLGDKALSYELMAADVLAVMDHLKLQRVDMAGWSDGAIVGLIIAMRQPARLDKLYAFGANMTTTAMREPRPSPVLAQVGPRLEAAYRAVAGAGGDFDKLTTAVRAMQKTEPNYSDAQLAAIPAANGAMPNNDAAPRGPRIAIVGAEYDEVLSPEYVKHLASTIPNARLIMLSDVSHFAPWQAPAAFNASLLGFLNP
ncbi:alpha/beta fold hydrolase [Duganella sp. FT94W]|uniref:Alpha/beta fold hydrolase n=1 Tax=Duganella lactea TaxID=2692173 RepID=A0ABW9V873_9BURK|nr:alpha/beta fold hydrolase [Duganella lactea]